MTRPMRPTKPLLDFFLRAAVLLLPAALAWVFFSLSIPAQTPQVGASETSNPQNLNLDDRAARDAQIELDRIQGAITLSRQRSEELRNEISQMSGDRARQNAALIAAAQRVKLAEIEIGAIEERLSPLLVEESEIRSRLDSADIDISSLLAALQLISKNPPPALIIDPSDALNSARSAALLAAILPQLQEKADTIAADLNRLATLKQAVSDEKEQLSARLSTLLEEQLRIATLIEARRRGVIRVSADLEQEERQAEALAGEAGSLNQLIAALKQRISSVSDAAEAADAADAGTQVGATRLSRQAMDIALANTTRTTPAVPFTSARGFLLVPAAGVVINEFGSNDGFGGISKGVSIVTRAEAQVVAPVDGWIMYKGPYLNYGQIIIINPGQGHTILLAGLETVSVELGQFVLMGEPVGLMGSRTLGQTITTSAGVSRPTLYVELRNRNQPLDPAPWWSAGITQSQSQSG